MAGSATLKTRPELLQGNIERLYRAGFALIPLGGPDGKKPLVANWIGKRLPLDVIVRRMANGNSRSYGVRLDGLLVVDQDTDNQQTREVFSRRFDPSSVMVKTSRGLHHYYENHGAVPKAIRDLNVAVDFKAGSRAFVLGPGSVRPDGTVYEAVAGDLAADQLPEFRDRGTVHSIRFRSAPTGSRHTHLIKKAVEYAPVVEDFDGLMADLLGLRDLECDDPDSIPDDEVTNIARWAWRHRLEGTLWSGRNSTVQINRMVLDWLLPRQDGPDALALYLLLLSNHGHQPGKTFAIVPDALLSSELMGKSRRQIYRARDTLLEIGLLRLVRRGRVKEPNLYQLRSPLTAAGPLIQGGRVLAFTLSASEAHETA